MVLAPYRDVLQVVVLERGKAPVSGAPAFRARRTFSEGSDAPASRVAKSTIRRGSWERFTMWAMKRRDSGDKDWFRARLVGST
jgi:hypothetical protein